MESIFSELYLRARKLYARDNPIYNKARKIFEGEKMIKYWKDVDILDIELKEGKYKYSEEIAEGVILDIDKNGEIISIEIMDMSKRLDDFVIEVITRQYLMDSEKKVLG